MALRREGRPLRPDHARAAAGQGALLPGDRAGDRALGQALAKASLDAAILLPLCRCCRGRLCGRGDEQVHLTGNDIVTVVVKESTLFGEGTLAMIFDAASHELRQWTITDAQGLDTSVAIYNVEKDTPVNESRFAIKYLREKKVGSNR